ncbi:phage tail tube protein [Streptomyces sp. WI03-4A]|uniref:phage tail tube protein n=1 Tax=Streptomyces sp. WI03-4A TaxID=3028706 RepID=UPI0029B9215F|nr:phage tail tube protein [Streptomyces sp. WI03-4A]MDX2590986.1 phage tail tube protein [Streptomyces sp. WI03-4A]
MPKATQLSFLGIAKETTPGTPVAATQFIPVTQITPKDNLSLLDDKGYRGALVDVYDQIAGVLSGTVDFDGDVFPDTVGFPLAGLLSDVVTTGASAPFSHVFSVLNSGSGQPTSYTLNDNYVAGNRQYPGAKFSELGFKFTADGLLTYSAKATTFGSITAAAPTTSFTAIPPMVGWAGVAQIAGVTQAGLLDGEVNIKRSVTIINSVDGTQAPAQLWSGPVQVDGKATLVMEDDTALTQYLTTAKPAIDFTFTSGAGATLVSLKLHMSKCSISAADITRGKDYIEVPITFTALANTTDIGASGGYSPIKVTLQNAVTSGTYK